MERELATEEKEASGVLNTTVKTTGKPTRLDTIKSYYTAPSPLLQHSSTAAVQRASKRRVYVCSNPLNTSRRACA